MFPLRTPAVLLDLEKEKLRSSEASLVKHIGVKTKQDVDRSDDGDEMPKTSNEVLRRTKLALLCRVIIGI
jgi:hypothetical protein